MIIYTCEQRSIEWLRLRTGKITASNADRLLTPAKLKTFKYEVLAESLSGILMEHYVSDAMQWGIDQEDNAINWYRSQDESRMLQKVGFAQHEEFLIAGCSPDLLVDDDGLCEIKCPNPNNHMKQWCEGPDKDYIAQIQFQMFVTGREWCDFVTYDPRFPEKLQGKIHLVKRNEAIINDLIAGIKEVDAFIDNWMLDNGAQPFEVAENRFEEF